MTELLHDTRRVLDITGPEYCFLLLPAPGDELSCAGLIAEACARGRPPFIAILTDGAPDGTKATAQRREHASRGACRILGLPAERLLFVGLRPGNIPSPGSGFFAALQAAMHELSWRHDCNVFAAAGEAASADHAATWQLAAALAAQTGLRLIACNPGAAQPLWRLDVSQWRAHKTRAAQAHNNASPQPETEFFARTA